MKKLFQKSLENKKEKKEKKSTYLLLLIGVLLMFFFFALDFPRLVCFSALLLSFSCFLLMQKEERKGSENKETCIAFYRLFILHSSLFGSYKEGFLKAIDDLTISVVKDSLKDYVDGESKGDLPLYYMNTRAEYSLVSLVQHLYYNDEEYLSSTTQQVEEYLFAFEKEGERKKETPVTLIAFSLFLLALAGLLL